MLCKICDNRGNCIKLCDEAEEYINIDYVTCGEIPVSQLGLDINSVIDSPWSDVKEIKLNQDDWNTLIDLLGDELTMKQQHFLRLYYWNGISYASLSRTHNITRQAITNIIQRAKQKIQKKLSKRPLTGL